MCEHLTITGGYCRRPHWNNGSRHGSPFRTIREWVGEVLRDLDHNCCTRYARRGVRRSRPNRCGAHGGCKCSRACGVSGN